MKAMKATLSIALSAAGLVAAANSAAQITFYEYEGYRGRTYTADESIRNMERFNFADRASSIVVTSGRWEVCDRPRYEGRCVSLSRGNYPTLSTMGMNNNISSVRSLAPVAAAPVYVPPPVSEPPYGPPPFTAYDYRRRQGETVFEAPVTSVHAVYGPPQQRCWVERERVAGAVGQPSVGGAVAGAIIGGILGHQIGRGGGRDVATVGGVAAGAAIGSQAGNVAGGYQDVQRCTTASSGPPAYWDVTYTFRGNEHRMQMAQPPGATVLVNGDGEPRA